MGSHEAPEETNGSLAERLSEFSPAPRHLDTHQYPVAGPGWADQVDHEVADGHPHPKRP